MEYRKLPHGDEQISIIGMGNSSLGASGEGEAEKTVTMALENGVNYFDMAAGDAAPFAAYGKALAGCREKAYLQVHFGADYHTGKYGWTQDLEEIKRSISWQLEALQTDYIDFGFIHCVDELSDLEKAVSGGVLDYIFQQAVQRLPVLCEMLRYPDTDFPHDKILGAVRSGKHRAAVVGVIFVFGFYHRHLPP